MQYYKTGDEKEKKVADAAAPVLTLIGTELDDFFAEAFKAYPLGDVLYTLGVDPMAGVITQDVFRISFPAIHDLFTRCGTFEFYMEVFRSIWGPDVEVVFTVPSPGVLEINITAINTSQANFLEREIISEQYIYNEVTDHTPDFLMFQDTIGIKTQREVDALINELSPAGVFVTAELELG